MKLRQIITSDMTASVLAHLSVLALVFMFSEVHPFGSVSAESVAVEIVTPQEIAETKPESAPTPTPLPDFAAIDKPAATEKPAAAGTPAPAPASAAAPQPQPSAPVRPQKQAAAPMPPPGPQMAAAQPPAQPVTPAPPYAAPEPDLSIKYHVLLGLPPDMSASAPPPPRPGDKARDDFDAAATKSADIASGVVAEFRRHLRTCLKLPASLAASDLRCEPEDETG